MQRFDDRLARLERDQEVLRSHYDRLYALNVEAITEMRAEVERLAGLVVESRGRRLPAPPDVPTMPDGPRTWHQSLRTKRVGLPTAGLGAAIFWAIAKLIEAIAKGQITLH